MKRSDFPPNAEFWKLDVGIPVVEGPDPESGGTGFTNWSGGVAGNPVSPLAIDSAGGPITFEEFVRLTKASKASP